MGDDEKEVAEKYKHLFKGYRFNFEGLKGETKQGFIKLVEDLGGEVSKDAPYVFVRKLYFEKKENNMREDLYNIDYITDAVNREDASNLLNYRFVRSPSHSRQPSNDEPMCYAARYFYKTDSCHKCYYEKAFCKECCETNEESQNGTSKENRQSIAATDSNSESKGVTVNSPKKKIDKDSSNSSKRYISSESEKNSADEEQNGTMHRNKSPAKKKVKKSSSFQNNLNMQKSPKTDVKNNHSKKDNYVSDDDVVSSFHNEGGQRVRKMFEGMHTRVKTGLVDSQNSNPDDRDLSDGPSIGKREKSASSLDKKYSGWITSKRKNENNPNAKEEPDEESVSGSASDVSIASDDGNNDYFRKQNWWLPHDVPDGERCTNQFCTFEPGPHLAHYQPGKFLSFFEKMIIVKYLIMNQVIHKAKTNSIYETMISDGYLTHRTAETLRNNFRRTIVFELHKYKLNPEHFKEFTALIDTRNTRKQRKVKHEKK